MGANYSSLDDMKADPNLRDLIKQAIQGSITESTEIATKMQKTTNVDAKSHQIASNTITTGGHALVGNAAKPISLKQTTKAKTVVQTLQLANYIKKQKSPVVQCITSDLVGLSVKDACETELPKWYDPKYILEMLGLTVLVAEFNFEKQQIDYILSPGEDAEGFKKKIKENFENTLEQHNNNLQWNDDHEMIRLYYQKRQSKLDGLNKQLDELINTDDSNELKQEIQKSKQAEYQTSNSVRLYLQEFKTTSIFQAYESLYLIIHDDKDKPVLSKDYVLSFEGGKEVDAKHRSIIYNKIYTENFITSDDQSIINSNKSNVASLYKAFENPTSVYGRYLKACAKVYAERIGDSEDKDTIEETTNSFWTGINSTPETTLLNLFSQNDYAPNFDVQYGDDYHDFTDLISEYVIDYADYKEKLVIHAFRDCKDMSPKEFADKKTFAAFREFDSDRSKFIGSNAIGGKDNQHEWDQVKTTWDNVYKSLQEEATAKIASGAAQAKFTKKHPDLESKVEALQKEINAITAELDTDEAKAAMKFYEYWETSPINEELIKRLQDDYLEYENKYKIMQEKDDFDESREIFLIKTKYIQGQNDAMMWKTLITGFMEYRDAEAKLAESVDYNGDAYVKSLLQRIYDTQEYQDKYNELKKTKTSAEMALVSPAQVVSLIDNNDLKLAYIEYYEALQRYIESQVGFEAVLNYLNRLRNSDDKDDKKYCEARKADFENMDKNIVAYRQGKHDEEYYKPIYEKRWAEFSKRSDANWQALSDLANEVSKYQVAFKTTQFTWEQYDEIVQGNFHKCRTFNELFSLLASGYVQQIQEKMESITNISTNIVKNITEASVLFASNEIEIFGVYGAEINVEQINDVVLTLKNNLKIVQDQTKDAQAMITNNMGVQDTTETNAEQSENVDSSIEESTEQKAKQEAEAKKKLEQSKGKNKWIIITAVVVFSILAICGLLAWYFLLDDSNANKKRKTVKAGQHVKNRQSISN